MKAETNSPLAEVKVNDILKNDSSKKTYFLTKYIKNSFIKTSQEYR